MSRGRKRVVMLADCQSFYVSVEKAAHPEYAHRPVVVAGDPQKRSGIVLAACPLAKRRGVVTAEPLGEARAKCPDLVVLKPHMEEYIRVSLQITDILQSYTDLVEPYSIDEQYLDVTGSIGLLGDPLRIAQSIQQKVRQETGVHVRIGISENKVLAKMACDNFAKERADGIFWMKKEELENTLWPLPVHRMFMVGSRMNRHLLKMGIRTIGDLARTPLAVLKSRWGINGEVLWLIANGHDESPVSPETHDDQKAIGHQMTLPFDYHTWEQIMVPLFELCDLVCQRCRAKGYMGTVVAVGSRGADFDRPTGFYRQMKLPDPTCFPDDVFLAAKTLFQRHWDGLPVRRIGVTLSRLVSDQSYQLVLFEDRERRTRLERALDGIRQKYGQAAVIRASSLQPFGQIRDRARKIGGHYK